MFGETLKPSLGSPPLTAMFPPAWAVIFRGKTAGSPPPKVSSGSVKWVHRGAKKEVFTKP